MIHLENEMQQDALTHFLARVRFDAMIHKHHEYCGSWAIDTSGSGRIPFHLIEKGQGWLHVVDNEPRLLQTGDLVLFPRDTPHAVSNAQTEPEKNTINQPNTTKSENFTRILCGFYIFDSEAAKLLLCSLPDVVILRDARNNPEAPSAGNLIEAMLLELEHHLPGRIAAVCDLSRLLLLYILRGNFKDISDGYLTAMSDPHISRALLIIHSRYGENWSVEKLAKEAGMSRTAFANHFHQLVGMPPVKYLTAWRIQEATTLLENTSRSVDQIAEQCGYQSVVSFRKAYKSATGLTPKQIRSNSKESIIDKAVKLFKN